MTYYHRGPTDAREPFRVFVSYPCRDEETLVIKPFVELVLNELDERCRGELRRFVWLDLDRITQGEPHGHLYIESRIADGVINSSRMLSFVSPRYWHSRWCSLEWGIALGAQVPIYSIIWKGPMGEFPPEEFPTFYDAREWSERRNDWRCTEFEQMTFKIFKFLASDWPAP
jgi:TIR domain